VIARAVATAVLIVLSIVVAALFTVPLVSTQKTSVEWFGWHFQSEGLGPPYEAGLPFTEFSTSGNGFCHPPNSVGNVTLSFVWQSSVANTTARFFWNVGSGLTPQWIYYVNHTSQGGYTFPPALLSFLCTSYNLVEFQWFTPTQSDEITLTEVREYNYTTAEPIW